MGRSGVNIKFLNSDIRVEIIKIGSQMNQAGLPKQFIAAAVETAFKFEGVYDLMHIWANETDPDEQAATIADIQDMVDECSRKNRKKLK